jgi:hypothetical protein
MHQRVRFSSHAWIGGYSKMGSEIQQFVLYCNMAYSKYMEFPANGWIAQLSSFFLPLIPKCSCHRPTFPISPLVI